MLVTTQRIKFQGKHYRTGAALPADISKADAQALKDAGLAKVQVSEAQVAQAAELTAKLAALQEAVTEGEARLSDIAAEVDAVKPLASELAARKAAAKKVDDEASRAAVAEAEEAQKALDALNKERTALEADVAAKRGALDALK